MSDKKTFRVDYGAFKMDNVMDSTKKFINDDIAYYYKFINEFAHICNLENPLSFINQEKNWTIAVEYGEPELGNIAEAKGNFYEGKTSSLQEIIKEL